MLKFNSGNSDIHVHLERTIGCYKRVTNGNVCSPYVGTVGSLTRGHYESEGVMPPPLTPSSAIFSHEYWYSLTSRTQM